MELSDFWKDLCCNNNNKVFGASKMLRAPKSRVIILSSQNEPSLSRKKRDELHRTRIRLTRTTNPFSASSFSPSKTFFFAFLGWHLEPHFYAAKTERPATTWDGCSRPAEAVSRLSIEKDQRTDLNLGLKIGFNGFSRSSTPSAPFLRAVYSIGP